MSTKTTQRAPLHEASAADFAPWNLLANLGRLQFALMADSASAMFRGAEAIRKVQQQAAHQASAHHEAAAQKLRDPREPAELLAIESDLLRFDMQEAAHYWQQIATAMMKAQLEMMGCTSHLLGSSAGDGFKPAIEAWQASLSASLDGAGSRPTTH